MSAASSFTFWQKVDHIPIHKEIISMSARMLYSRLRVNG
nr:MAG TPA: hypothetical protein [Caudoviricetes sp.]